MTLIDTDVLIDILSSDADWELWSATALQQHSGDGLLLINEIVYAELAGRYSTQEALDGIVDSLELRFEWLPKPALHLAG